MNTQSLALLESLIKTKKVAIKGSLRVVVGMARYATTNSPDAKYVKVAFSDNSGMYFLLDEPTVFYFDRKLGEVEGTENGQFGQQREIEWHGKKFTIVNANDYQYVKEFYIGTIHDLEGEVRFSDYADAEGNALSLGWNMFENKRDDVYAEPLEVNDIE